MGSLLLPLGKPLGGIGSSLVHEAPMSANRMTAAGPGKLSATLKTRTPRKLWSEGVKRVVLPDMVIYP
jgi:hypothetical protein